MTRPRYRVRGTGGAASGKPGPRPDRNWPAHEGSPRAIEKKPWRTNLSNSLIQLEWGPKKGAEERSCVLAHVPDIAAMTAGLA